MATAVGGTSICTFDSKELQATVLAVRAANKTVEAQIRHYTQTEMVPDWKMGLAQRAQTDMETRVLVDTARVTVSNQNVLLQSATVRGPKFSGGLDPRTDYAPFEFGADRGTKATFYRTSKRGKKSAVTRHNHLQFAPTARGGYVVYPTAKAMVPHFASMWVQTAMRTIMDAVDGKTSG